MKKLGIIGSGDLGQLIAFHANATEEYSVAGFFDDFKNKNDYVNNIPIIGGIADITKLFSEGIIDELIIGIGYKHFKFRKEVYEKFSSIIPMATIIHPSSYVDSSCKIGAGVFILPGCILDCNVLIKDNVLLNTACVIAHDTVVGAHTFLSPAVSIAGFVTIGECCNIGINSTIIDNIQIHPNTQTGGGTVVIKNITESGLYVGNPSKLIRS